MNIEHIMTSLAAKHPGESEYLQAVHEVLLSIEEVYNQHPRIRKSQIDRKACRTRQNHHLQSALGR